MYFAEGPVAIPIGPLADPAAIDPTSDSAPVIRSRVNSAIEPSLKLEL
jgi:hypothetical protein